MPKKILYLYTRLAGYVFPGLKALVDNYNVEVHLTHNAIDKNAPYHPEEYNGIYYYDRDELFPTVNKLKAFISELKPDIVYVTGRVNKDYLKISLALRREGIPTVSGFDHQWKGNLKNHITVILSYFIYKRYFDYMWAAGEYQFSYLERLGFPRSRILWNCLVANADYFNLAYESRLKLAQPYPHNLLYLGRFITVKNTIQFAEAFIESLDSGHNWTLTMIGNGPLKSRLPQHERIILKDFMQPKDLPMEMLNAGGFVLPSIRDNWGMVVQESAAAGLPQLTSYAVGAAPAFVRHGYNGYYFKTGDRENLKKAIIKLCELSDDQLALFGRRSFELSKKITPDMYAAELMSVLDR